MASLYRNVFGMTTAVSAALILASTAGAMIDNPEIEPNETRAQATIAASGGAGMAVGDTISGTTTGTSTTAAGAASADIFRVKTSARPLAIYRHRLTLTSSTLFQTGTIRGLTTTANSTTGGAVTTTDSTAQTAPTALTGGVPARAVQWYGFGKQEEIYYRVTGTTSSPGSYTATLSSDVVAPIDLGSVLTGNVTVARASSSTQDMDWWVYNSNFDAISNFGHDDPEPGSVTQPLAPGVYYIAAGNFNTANNQPPAIGDTFAGTVLDFPNAAMNNSTTLATNAAMTVSSSVGGGPLNGTATRTEAFQIVWYKFTVDPVTVPTNPSGTATATPATVTNTGASSTQFVVTVNPGLNPTSTGITVNANLTNLGGSATNAMFDDGAHGDGAAGDNVFGLAYTVPNTAVVGTQTVNFNIADAQTRAGTASTTVTVVPPPPANDECVNATVISGAGNFPYSNFQATSSTFATTGCVTPNLDVWFRWTAPTAGGFRFATCATLPSYDSAIAIYDGAACPTAATAALGCNDDFCGLLSQTDVTLAQGQEVLIRVGSFGTATTTTGTLTITGLTPTNPTGTGTATPNQAVNDVSTPVTFVVDTTGGQFPNSTGLGVTLDTTLIGGGVITLLDDGNAPDVTAGDGNFSGAGTVAMGTTPGALALPFTVTDAEMRSGAGTIAISVREPSGGCCVMGSCSITTLSACNTAGGTFLGDGAACAQEGTYDINGSITALEDISATGTVITTTGDDQTFAVALSFPFPFYGVPQNTCNVSTNGNIQFPPSNSTGFTNGDLPSAGVPNGALYVCWDDFNFTAGSLLTETRGTPGVDLRQIFQWNNVPQFGGTDSNTFQAVLFENGTVEYRYGAMTASIFAGNDCTIGVENAAGTAATQLDETLVGPNTSVAFIYSGAQSNCPSGCRADFNNDGTLDPDDLADYIGAFFTEPAPLTADFNGDGTVDPDDLADYIGAFFAGCP